MRLNLFPYTTFTQNIKLRMIRLISGGIPGPMMVMTVKRDLFGKHLAKVFQEALREPTRWRVDEAEMFAAFVSSMNECPYCLDAHTAVAMLAADNPQLITTTLADRGDTAVSDKHRAMLTFLEKLNTTPDAVTKADIEALHAVGLDDTAIHEAVYVCFGFSIINRFANTLGFPLDDEKTQNSNARMLIRQGYGGSSLT